MVTGEPTSQSISVITPKIPPFYPDLWFLRAESAFNTAKPRITDDETKVVYLIQSLNEETALRIKDLLMKPKMGGQFEALKTRLMKTFGLKRHEGAALIIDYPDIGDGSAGIIRRSKSAWSSALHMVPQDDGTWRPCGDYRHLKKATKDDK